MSIRFHSRDMHDHKESAAAPVTVNCAQLGKRLNQQEVPSRQGMTSPTNTVEACTLIDWHLPMTRMTRLEYCRKSTSEETQPQEPRRSSRQ
mmetsp:Transcript_16292/g.26752  ORF Transcript_16292/g.26752 Transcript_16292/m.26752 type:complete len:91 (+) Transcript_16292:179-451(+)|eukprot:scaffold34571_cov702-Skeletonema_menzelii.AAC.1